MLKVAAALAVRAASSAVDHSSSVLARPKTWLDVRPRSWSTPGMVCPRRSRRGAAGVSRRATVSALCARPRALAESFCAAGIGRSRTFRGQRAMGARGPRRRSCGSVCRGPRAAGQESTAARRAARVRASGGPRVGSRCTLRLLGGLRRQSRSRFAFAGSQQGR